ncbi:MAG TPA: 16S rRNA (cytidine(1402)-2'-O)-methyltransferase [Blastocatellia bacterium]
MAGTLYLVATPIGNLEDITLRALRVLIEVNIIACEDTRHTQKLLNHFDIAKPLLSYHEHNERERALELCDKLEAGADVALVSDAGTPLVSDPGFRLVQEATARNIPVVPVPGATALIAALAASGLPTNEFVFCGFLPSRRTARRARLSEFLLYPSTLIFYESPYRIRQTLEDAQMILGDRDAAVARELTKVHEEFVRGKLSRISTMIGQVQPRGEYVLLIGPRPAGELPAGADSRSQRSILEEVEDLMESEGLDQKTALKKVAHTRGINRRDAYMQMVKEIEETKGEE